MNKNIQRGLIAVGAIAVTSAQAAVPEAVSTAVASGVTDTLAVIAIGGAAMLSVAGGGVVWQVASKFVKRLGGKA